ncbi:MAG TPA: SDR family oxidoreductase [bacterium]|nr:SDR family oxidoreductase [bacterium]
MNKKIEKTALITGASSGIGRAAAVRFSSGGYRIALVSRNDSDLEETAGLIKAKGGQARVIPADLTDNRQTEQTVQKTVSYFGRLDCLVNAAGIIGSGTVENTTPDAWDFMMNINLRSVFMLIQQCVPHLEKTRGTIVNVSSVTGIRSFPGLLTYCVSKAGVDQLTRCAALELAPKSIRVNAINPGVIRTNLHRRGGMDEAAYSRFLEHSKTTHPLGRVGEPEEAAELIFFLAEPSSSWITGATIPIDGGRAQTCAR